MNDLQTILTTRFPRTEERIESQLVFLEKYGVEKLYKTALEKAIQFGFYKAKFLTGHRKFAIIDTIVGLSVDNNVYLLTNPLFSDRYSDIVRQFEKIKSNQADRTLISEIVDLYRETGAKITELSDYKYQIWFGENRWRELEFNKNATLKIETRPSSRIL